MAKGSAMVIYKRCKPEQCSADGRCPAIAACEYHVLKQDSPGEPPYAFAMCKGCGGCVPVYPKDAIDLEGYTDAQIRAMIEGMLEEPVPC